MIQVLDIQTMTPQTISIQFYAILFVIVKFFFQRTSSTALETCSEQSQPEQY